MDSEQILSVVIAARDEASNTIRKVGESLNNVLEIAAGFSLANIGEEFAGAAKSAVDAAINFQAVTTSLGTVLGNVSSGGEDASESFGGSASKISDIASRTADEMRNYAEKVKKYQEDIADAMAGDNIIQAQQSLQDRLSKISEEISNASGVEKDRELQRQQSMQDTLVDMKDNYEVKAAGRKEKYEQDLLNATSEKQKKEITKKYQEQEKLDQDNYDREYALKQKQLQRNMDEQNKADQEQTQKRIKALQEQQADERKASDEKIAQLKKENEKKIEMYKQELSDEEIAHTEHLARLQEESEKATGGMAAKITKPLEKDSPFKAIRRSLQEELSFITKLEPKMPFDFNDIVQLDRHMTQFGVNGQKVIPILGDLASVANTNLATVGQAVTDATKAGRWQMMEQDLGVTKEELKEFGAEFDKQGHLIDEGSFWKALEKMDTKGGPIFGGMANQMGTMKGQLTNLHTTFFQLGEDILGVDVASGKVTKGGLFDQMTHMLMAFGNYMKDHKEEIANAAKAIFGAIENVASKLEPLIEWLMNHKDVVVSAIIGIGGAILISMIPALLGAALAFAGLTLAALPWIALSVLIAAAAYLIITHWKDLQKVGEAVWKGITDAIKTAVSTAGTWIKDFISGVISGINTLIHGINSLSGKLPGIGKAIQIPDIKGYDQGGYVPNTGLAMLHQGEFVLSKDMLSGKQPAPAYVTNNNMSQPINIYATINTEMDLSLLANKVAFAVRNSR